MSGSFSFGFQNDDIEDNIGEANVQITSQHTENLDVYLADAQPAQAHDLRNLIKALPSSISYSSVHVQNAFYDGTPLIIPRRELFDIRAQLMAEAQDLGNDVGLSKTDITPHIYEGGFKTWECSVDLAGYLSAVLSRQSERSDHERHFIELGAGTALPTLILFHYILKRQTPQLDSVYFSIADYNLSVLENATIPNLLLTWHFARSSTPPLEGDLEITPDLLSSFLADLANRSIHISGVTGAWGGDFCSLVQASGPSMSVQKDVETIVLASETIYSPSSTRVFTEVLVALLRSAQQAGGKAEAFVAAKRIYFGVGGGIDEFLTTLAHDKSSATTVWESRGPGVERVILRITSE